ncbi:tRNA (N6-isopentenyl adenosine(37)-C2)-methylthiotransferase MiaB [Chrysiogenes arsenatis]|uniref:tRNA (N6-isopentenyl adenosine(37)-C2)-methylthiotransferase MiaB n=1 Tax=Chrysiogenes arsenatis TaxID=309797 RepID=UPI0003FC918D|nr:tRNA (N6-isopentenyl adenosine(37)-C2)-methylthiotransferase MiaB [Chrysiogenes arsenatis]
MKIEKVYIKTYGCQMNVHDSERIKGILAEHSIALVETPEAADMAVFNTCSVRAKAEQKVFSDIGRLRPIKKKRPDYKIAVCGCIPQVQREALLQKNPLIDLVFGVNNISRFMEFVTQAELGKRHTHVIDDYALDEYEVSARRDDPMRAYVTIMNGCDNFCSYCIVPYTRGREQSRPVAAILDELHSLVATGVREVTLLGQNVNSYRGLDGAGTAITFPELLRLVHAIPELVRIRFVTSHPKDFTEELIEAMKLPRICKYLHLPIQAGSDRILGLMKRGYTAAEYLAKVAQLKAAIPDIALSSDFLVGFPSETEEDFQETLRIVEAVEYAQIFAFNYSPRPETVAAKMEEQIPFEVMNERLNRLFAKQNEIAERARQQFAGQTLPVLVEGWSKNNTQMLAGRTDTNAIVHFAGDDALIGTLVMVRITDVKLYSMTGEVVR